MNTKQNETKVGAMTPGPWKAEGCRVSAEGVLSVCMCNASGQDPVANARVIAALPELVEALQGAYAQLVAFEDSFEGAGVHDLWEDAVSNAKAALHKAGCL